MNDTPTSDAAVWVPGIQTPEYGRLPGIAETTLSALREIGLLNEIDQTEDGVIAYPGAVIEEPTYQSIGIKEAWFIWLQQDAKTRGLPVPERSQDLDKATRKEARQAFKKAASSYQGQEITIKEEENDRTSQKELIAYIGDDVRLGVVSNPDQLADGQKITIKCSFARSSNLRIAMEPTAVPIHETKD